MKLVLDNLTYHNCPVQDREKVAFTPEQRHSMLRKMHAEEKIGEALILETCNRLEFYLYAAKNFDCRAFLADLIARLRPDALDTWTRCSSETTGIDIVTHLFEVAAGLDSQMIGENQILAQVKAAYTKSLHCRMSRLVFHRLFHNAFRVGKAVRTQTDINCGAVSIGLAAVELAKSRLDLSSCCAMLVGAGENAELVATYLAKASLPRLIVANRSPEKAVALCSRVTNAETISLEEIPAALAQVDFLVSTTASAEPVLDYESVAPVLAAREKPLLLIDIAVPRDIDPRIAEFDCVTLCNIDDLNAQINANRRKRSSQIPKARAIVSQFTDKFARWYDSLDVVPVISGLTRKGVELARAEAARYAKDFGPDSSEKLRAFAESLVRKVLHGPISFIREGDAEQPGTDQLQAIDLINKMFLYPHDDL